MIDENDVPEHGSRGVQVDFVFGRRLLNHALTEFIPPIFICIVSFCTSFFKVINSHIYTKEYSLLAILQPIDFDASMTVNVTLMLCLVTLFTSMLNSLPKTSSVKLMDVWVVFNLMVPFFEIILQTLLYKLGNDHINRDEDGKYGMRSFQGKSREDKKLEPAKSKSVDDDMTESNHVPTILKHETTEHHNASNDEADNVAAVSQGSVKRKSVKWKHRETERQKLKEIKVLKKGFGRYLLVNIIKFVLPGLYTLFCFIFFLIGLIIN